MPLGYPLVSGVRFDASSIELKINTLRYIGVTEIQYEQELLPGEVRGLNPQILGFTRGMYKVSGTLTILREEFQDLTSNMVPPAAIPTGAVAGTSTDTIVGMRFTGTRHRAQGGSSDGLTVEMPFIARYLLTNGIPALNSLLKMAVAATAP